MELIAQTGERGVVVTANACSLSVAITSTSSSLVLSHSGVFASGSTVTIGIEDIVLDTVSSTNASAITREANSTTAASHAANMYVREADGAELLSHAFTSEILGGIIAGGDAPGHFMIEEAGTKKRRKITTAYIPEAFWPGNKWTVGSGTTIKILVWLFRVEESEAVFWGEFQK